MRRPLRDRPSRKSAGSNCLPEWKRSLTKGNGLCKGTALLRELTVYADAVSSLGERLSAPMVAAALEELGVRSEAVEATELSLHRSLS